MPTCSHPFERTIALFPASDYVTGDRFEIRRCGACGLALTWPPPQPEHLAAYYPAIYYGKPGSRRFPGPVEMLQAALYGRRAARVEAAVGGRVGRVLDVGCGPGHLLAAFRRRGWQTEGTELSEQSAANARVHHGLEVHVGRIEALGLPGGRFDAVSMWHVLEHIANPDAVLAEVHRLLRPGGILFVSVPDFASPEARLSRAGWFHLDVPRHLVHFTPRTLGALLAATGFATVRESWFAPEFDLFSFVQSAENRIGLRANLLYDVLRRRGARLRAVPPVPAAIALALAVPLALLGLPVTLLAGLCRRGTTMTVLARKAGDGVG